VADTTVSVLTMQHEPDPVVLIGELQRVTRRGGRIVCVDADNVAQAFHLPHAHPQLTAALHGFWSAVREAYLPSDISVGPSLPRLFREAGLKIEEVDVHLVTVHAEMRAETWFERAVAGFVAVARRYQLEGSSALREMIGRLESVRTEYRGFRDFYAIQTMPLFLTTAIC
jgi:SAM-dependent methyltransferase